MGHCEASGPLGGRKRYFPKSFAVQMARAFVGIPNLNSTYETKCLLNDIDDGKKEKEVK